EIEVELIMLRVAQRRRLGINLGLFSAAVGTTQDAQPFGVRGHESVFDSVVNHLDEMAGAVWAAMQIALLCGAVKFLASGSARGVTAARRKGGKNGIQAFDHFRFAAD